MLLFLGEDMKYRFRWRSAITIAALLATSACHHGDERKSPEPTKVGVVTLVAAPADLVTELAGRTTPFMMSDVRPQIGGIVLKRLFEEGALVSKGQLLYQINPAPYQANYNRAKAELARAQATLVSVENRATRASELVKIDAVSHQDADDARSARGEAVANVASARAALEAARIDLDFTHIVAPISGRIGRSAFTPGALVTTGQAAPLATIQTLDPIYVDVARSSAELLKLKQALAVGEAQQPKEVSLKEYGRTRKRPSCVDHVQEYLRTFDLTARFCYKTTGPGNTSPWRKSGIGHGRNRHCPHDG